MLASVVETAAASEVPWYWWAIGFGGQAVFGSRFIVQWIASERAKRSVMPNVFWWLSILGGLMLLSYACYIADPVFILGQATGTLVYARNLQFVKREKRSEASD